MSDEDKPFSIELGALKARPREQSPTRTTAVVDKVGEDLGFVDRKPTKRRGRKPSPRTGQIHAKVMPDVARAVADEARRRGVQQGVIIEEAWALYLEKTRL